MVGQEDRSDNGGAGVIGPSATTFYLTKIYYVGNRRRADVGNRRRADVGNQRRRDTDQRYHFDVGSDVAATLAYDVGPTSNR